MAQRDKSQGFGFIYADIQTLLRQRGELAKMDQWEPLDAPAETQVVNMNKDEARGEATAPVQPSVEQIKENLDRLAKLHQKLHVMLDEINRLNGKKSSDN